MTASRPATWARAAPCKPVVDLMLQQFGRLIEQVDPDQTVRKTSDHLVAAPSDRGQFAKIVEQCEGIDGRHPSPLPARNNESKVPAASS